MIVTYLILLLRFLYIVTALRPCVPNSQFLVDGKICNCDNQGQWTESTCLAVGRKHNCESGQVIWQGCKRCICQEDGEYICTRDGCTDASSSADKAVQKLGTVMPWCTPFRSYYINCNICVCPPSGRSAEAHCATDISCSLQLEPVASDLSSNKNICIPKVMYLFPCLHCLCTDEGVFALDKCVETCIARATTESTRKCIPMTFYRKDCNVCKCPVNGIPNDTLCTNHKCNESTVFSRLSNLRSKPVECTPHTFTKAACYYCDCKTDMTIDLNACLELDCFNSSEFKYDIPKQACRPGEMVPVCTECLCLRSGITSNEYCSKTCSYQSKLNVMEKIAEANKGGQIIDKESIKRNSADDSCVANSIYIDLGRYCLCPENGNTNFNLCTPADDNVIAGTTNPSVKINIDFNMSCEPNSFVDFDCNTCFCSKKGKIDPKWCTYDDCESKRLILKSHDSPNSPTADMELNDTCVPGSISQVGCNFCICPETGYVGDKVCTKNDCAPFGKLLNNDKFICEPLAYYEVDCNICYCPRDGMKNVARCTKNHCEKSFLRSDVCVPSQLFIEDCNVCVCPPNGNKADRVCTNNTCSDSAPWKKIYQLSESLIGNQIPEDATRNLDLCFPGEEFQIGCKLCVCPDMGLRSYASCSPMLCEEDDKKDRKEHQGDPNRSVKTEELPVEDIGGGEVGITRRREVCVTYNVTSAEETKCNPGSMYILMCEECICPYIGDLQKFCRPLPENFYCEQPMENAYYVPSSAYRRLEGNSSISINTTGIDNSTAKPKIKVPEHFEHIHTKYNCDKPGKVMDNCFICECEESGVIIEEHCFKSSDEKCKNMSPSFLKATHLFG